MDIKWIGRRELVLEHKALSKYRLEKAKEDIVIINSLHVVLALDE